VRLDERDAPVYIRQAMDRGKRGDGVEVLLLCNDVFCLVFFWKEKVVSFLFFVGWLEILAGETNYQGSTNPR